jgi:xanthine dehydrogenase YagR molybdenum-binding subunit
MSTNYIGQPVNRVDGRVKVTGQAKYAAEFNQEKDLTHGFVVSSAIASGKITSIDTSAALAVKGVLQVFTHENVPNLAWFDKSYQDQDAPKKGSPFRPLHSNKILFSMQPVALVIAETFELARHAASLVKVTYKTEPLTGGFEKNLEKAEKPKTYKVPLAKPRGNAKKAFDKADIKVDSEYFHGCEHHNPMEMHATTVTYGDDDSLTIYDKTQSVFNSLQYVTLVFGLLTEKVRVISPFVGGAFGSGLRPQYQLFMATLAALELKRSVKVVLTRQQMFSFGHRPATLQRIKVGASADGKIQAIINDTFSETSKFEEYTENIVNWSGLLYNCENFDLSHKVVAINTYTPLDMRAPGGVTGVYATECAVDEAAWQVGMDPLEFRIKNYAEKDQNDDLPFSSKELMACYRQGAEKFGWNQRNSDIRSMKDGNCLVGYGVATGAWEAQQMPARAKARLSIDGKLEVSCGTADIGTGTYVSMTQVAADTLGLPLEDVTFKLGDSALPLAPLQGGSWTAATVGSAVFGVCNDIKKKLLKLAIKIDGSPFKKADEEDVLFEDGSIRLKKDPSVAYSFIEIMRQSEVNFLEEDATSLPDKSKQSKYSRYTHSAVFVEVKIDEDFGAIHVTRMVSAVAAGKIINPKTSRSQILGGMVWGIGMALEEDSFLDNNFGRFMNHDLAEYHVPVNADIKDLDVIFVEEQDDIVNPLGVKGLGEIGIVGVAAAISNAVYHATGKRIRSLPITLDKVLV